MTALVNQIRVLDQDDISVLVVDDVVPIVEEILTLLELRDIAAVAATTLEGAVRALEESRNISVVVCDVRLGRDSGIDLIQLVKANPRLAARELEYVFVTGDPTGLSEFPEGLNPVVLTKPVNPREFINIINELRMKRET